MRYMLLILTDESAWAQQSEEQIQQVTAEYYAFGDWVRDKMVAGEALQPSAVTKQVAVRNGKTVMTDGPFAETKEQVGGFYLVDCRDEQEAIEIAARIPGAKSGTIEVRPCQEFPEQPEHAATPSGEGQT
jgi:hypothetical protein